MASLPHLHHVSEFLLGNFSVRMSLEEVCVPLIDFLSGQSCVTGDEVEILIAEDSLAAAMTVAHLAAASGTVAAVGGRPGAGRWW